MIVAMPHPPRKSLFRSLGEFVGHISKAVRTDPAKPGSRPASKPASQRTKLDEQVQEREATDEQGRPIILRRTTIDEVEYPDRN